MTVNSVLTWLQGWAEVLGALGSILLSIALVGLYYQQYRLHNWEYNHDIRRRHTETLKKRIRVWHGNIDQVSAETDLLTGDQTNLPSVNRASVSPAAGGVNVATNEEEEFWVVPTDIKQDRYLKDLLANHAQDLARLRNEIKAQHKEFADLRAQFTEEYDAPNPLDKDGFTVATTSSFPRWLFESFVQINRSSSETELDDIVANIEEESIQSGGGNPNTEEFFWGSYPESGKSIYILKTELDNNDIDVFDNNTDVEATGAELTQQELKRYMDTELSDLSAEAADILDEMSASIEELQTNLVEYEGEIHYAGDCEFISDSQF